MFIAAAILTPPDIFSQVSLAVPLLLLYEISIICCRMVEKKRAKREAEEEAELGSSPARNETKDTGRKLMLELYHAPQSTCSQKVRIALAEKNLDWTERRVNLPKNEQLRPEYLKLNPNGVVPTLVHDGKVIIDSSVILEYLDEVFPQAAAVAGGSGAPRPDARLDALSRRGADRGDPRAELPQALANRFNDLDEKTIPRDRGRCAAGAQEFLPPHGAAGLQRGRRGRPRSTN